MIADPATMKSRAMLHAVGDFVESLAGRYITSFDSGTSLDDVRTIGERTFYTAGTLPQAGDASETTAYGVYTCMRVAAEAAFGTASLSGIRIAVQGVGNVGGRLVERLALDGADVLIADADRGRAEEIAQRTGARVVGTDAIASAEVDILSPCALGAVLSARTIPAIKARAIVGGANNQLAEPADAERLMRSGILYCPDYLANAGGIINLHYQRSVWSRAAVERHVERLGETFRLVIDRAKGREHTTAAVADRIAEERFKMCAGVS